MFLFLFAHFTLSVVTPQRSLLGLLLTWLLEGIVAVLKMGTDKGSSCGAILHVDLLILLTVTVVGEMDFFCDVLHRLHELLLVDGLLQVVRSLGLGWAVGPAVVRG